MNLQPLFYIFVVLSFATLSSSMASNWDNCVLGSNGPKNYGFVHIIYIIEYKISKDQNTH